MSKAKSVLVCVFTNTPPGGWLGTLPSKDLALYEAVSQAGSDLFVQEGIEGTLSSPCYAKAPEFQDFLKTPGLPSVPFIAVIGEFSDGSKRYYTSKTSANIKNVIRSMWSGEFGGTGIPTNPGEGDGGWGQGDGGILCQLFPPLCALGFLPWLALATIATYKTAESRSTTGKAMWGIPAALLWMGFVQRGGIKQIQWWAKKAGIGSIEDLYLFRRLEKVPATKKLSRKFKEDVEQILFIEYTDEEKDFLLTRLFERNGYIYSRDAALKILYEDYYRGKEPIEKVTKGIFKN